jgi:hypothetical protein
MSPNIVRCPVGGTLFSLKITDKVLHVALSFDVAVVLIKYLERNWQWFQTILFL